MILDRRISTSSREILIFETGYTNYRRAEVNQGKMKLPRYMPHGKLVPETNILRRECHSIAWRMPSKGWSNGGRGCPQKWGREDTVSPTAVL